MIRIGITGQSGFMGTHLYNTLGLFPDEFERVPFKSCFWEDEKVLQDFVKRCDVIVHLAGMNRSSVPGELYRTNIRLVEQLIRAMTTAQVTPHVIFSSSIQEELDNEYGRSKREGRLLFEKWATSNQASFTGLIIPNVYGPFGKPDYNSFIATFCHRLTHGGQPAILSDREVRLVYIGSWCYYVIKMIRLCWQAGLPVLERKVIPPDFTMKVSDVLGILENYKTQYCEQGIIPVLKDRNELNLFNTFLSYTDLASIYPRKLTSHADQRGVFTELIKTEAGGQVSFSTTVPGVTRGNHYHTRKIERFIVIKGKACIRLRKVDGDEILCFYLDGTEPAYVDIPAWYTHNITNIGEDELCCLFWINEWYDPADGDTYFEPCDKNENYKAI